MNSNELFNLYKEFLLPAPMAEPDQDIDVFLKLLAGANTGIFNAATTLPDNVDVNLINPRYLKWLANLVGYEYKPSVSPDVQREIIKRILNTYREKGSHTSIKKAVLFEGSPELFIIEKRPLSLVEIYEPYVDLFRFCISKWSGTHHLQDGVYWTHGVYEIRTKNALLPGQKSWLTYVHPAGTKVYFSYWYEPFPAPSHGDHADPYDSHIITIEKVLRRLRRGFVWDVSKPPAYPFSIDGSTFSGGKVLWVSLDLCYDFFAPHYRYLEDSICYRWEDIHRKVWLPDTGSQFARFSGNSRDPYIGRDERDYKYSGRRYRQYDYTWEEIYPYPMIGTFYSFIIGEHLTDVLFSKRKMEHIWPPVVQPEYWWHFTFSDLGKWSGKYALSGIKGSGDPAYHYWTVPCPETQLIKHRIRCYADSRTLAIQDFDKKNEYQINQFFNKTVDNLDDYRLIDIYCIGQNSVDQMSYYQADDWYGQPISHLLPLPVGGIYDKPLSYYLGKPLFTYITTMTVGEMESPTVYHYWLWTVESKEDLTVEELCGSLLVKDFYHQQIKNYTEWTIDKLSGRAVDDFTETVEELSDKQIYFYSEDILGNFSDVRKIRDLQCRTINEFFPHPHYMLKDLQQEEITTGRYQGPLCRHLQTNYYQQRLKSTGGAWGSQTFSGGRTLSGKLILFGENDVVLESLVDRKRRYVDSSTLKIDDFIGEHTLGDFWADDLSNHWNEYLYQWDGTLNQVFQDELLRSSHPPFEVVQSA